MDRGSLNDCAIEGLREHHARQLLERVFFNHLEAAGCGGFAFTTCATWRRV